MRFEWDPKKAATNERKHGVPFPEATTAFNDLYSITVPDPDHSIAEARWLLLGRSHRDRLLVVGHTEQADTIRIFNARLATRREHRTYEEDLP
ncbi:MAG TPA: BrnT family toxin [Gemmatimonadales bacterium]|nr:BrnT family toxin [Gemmatimonadales bacterium]